MLEDRLPLTRGDFTSNDAYARYLDTVAMLVDMQFSQRSHAENALVDDTQFPLQPPVGVGGTRKKD